MTVNQIQEQLIGEIRILAADISFTDGNGQDAVMKYYTQAIPIRPVFEAVPLDEDEGTEAEQAVYPYCIVRVSDVRYSSDSAKACLKIIFGINDNDPEMKGYFTLAAIIEKVILRFQTDTVLGPFYCDRDMETAFQEDNTFPYFFGGIEMTWNLPGIDMEELA